MFLLVHYVLVTKGKLAFYFLYAVSLDLNDPLLRFYTELKYLWGFSLRLHFRQPPVLSLTGTIPGSHLKPPEIHLLSKFNHCNPKASRNTQFLYSCIFGDQEKFASNYNACGKRGRGWILCLTRGKKASAHGSL